MSPASGVAPEAVRSAVGVSQARGRLLKIEHVGLGRPLIRALSQASGKYPLGP